MSHGGKGDKPRPYSVSLETFDANWDAIFKKNKAKEASVGILENEELWSQRVIDEDNMQVRVPEEGKKIGTCGCGRSPTGDCIGWHGLTEDQFQTELAKYREKIFDERAREE